MKNVIFELCKSERRDFWGEIFLFNTANMVNITDKIKE